MQGFLACAIGSLLSDLMQPALKMLSNKKWKMDLIKTKKNGLGNEGTGNPLGDQRVLWGDLIIGQESNDEK